MIVRVSLATCLLAGCLFGEDGPPALPKPSPGPKRMFVTSQTYQAAMLGGLAGADASCGERASAAGLTGYYRAWLSSNTAYDSPSGHFSHSDDVYQLVDGTPIAQGWNGLTSGQLATAIDRDETGQPYGGAPTCNGAVAVWSTTDSLGRAIQPDPYDLTCGAWSSSVGDARVGDVHRLDGGWTDAGCTLPCTERAALYCIEQ